jgi:hypothetical protein
MSRRKGISAARWDRLGGRSAARLALCAATALVLAACQVPQPGVHAGGSRDDAQAPEPGATQAPKQTVLAVTPAVAHPSDTVAPIAPVRRLSGDPKELVGLDHAVVRRALGDPVRVRSEASAEVWQYMTGDCVVDLYLYNQDGSLTVTYVEARSHKAEMAPTARCLKSLLERPTASAR